MQSNPLEIEAWVKLFFTLPRKPHFLGALDSSDLILEPLHFVPTPKKDVSKKANSVWCLQLSLMWYVQSFYKFIYRMPTIMWWVWLKVDARKNNNNNNTLRPFGFPFPYDVILITHTKRTIFFKNRFLYNAILLN